MPFSPEGTGGTISGGGRELVYAHTFAIKTLDGAHAAGVTTVTLNDTDGIIPGLVFFAALYRETRVGSGRYTIDPEDHIITAVNHATSEITLDGALESDYTDEYKCYMTTIVGDDDEAATLTVGTFTDLEVRGQGFISITPSTNTPEEMTWICDFTGGYHGDSSWYSTRGVLNSFYSEMTHGLNDDDLVRIGLIHSNGTSSGFSYVDYHPADGIISLSELSEANQPAIRIRALGSLLVFAK